MCTSTLTFFKTEEKGTDRESRDLLSKMILVTNEDGQLGEYMVIKETHML